MWPEGTVLYEVAPAQVHAVAATTLKAQGAQIQRGCLHVRVAAELQVPAPDPKDQQLHP